MHSYLFVIIGKKGPQDLDSAMADLKMDQYDESEDEGEGVKGIFGKTNPGMAYYGDNIEDPYIKLSAMEEIDSEAEDEKVRKDDFVLLAAKNEDDLSLLEVWISTEFLFLSFLNLASLYNLFVESSSLPFWYSTVMPLLNSLGIL